MGRNPHLGPLSNGGQRDAEAVRQAMSAAGLLELRGRDVSTVSGGEYQRVLIARALAQEAAVLLLDEPASHLDMKYQVETLAFLRSLEQKLVIATFHDIFLAGFFAAGSSS